MQTDLQQLLAQSAIRHSHLCPRQVLGVRMAIAGLAALGLRAPLSKADGLVIVETDGCFVDGIEVATGAAVGHRTLRVIDYGKIAATFVNATTGAALRLSPEGTAREAAAHYAPDAGDPYDAQVKGYQRMPEAALLHPQWVSLTRPVTALISQPDVRWKCDACGEEIFNERFLLLDDQILCRHCAVGGYYVGPKPSDMHRQAREPILQPSRRSNEPIARAV